MDRRLEEAAYAGDLALLRRLIKEDRLLLHRQAIAASVDGPLHIAASLGHVEFVHQMLVIYPELARRCNGEGLSALHLAIRHGHLPVVKELLSSAIATQLCFVRDNDGFMPIHTATVQGRIDVLGELLDACLESKRALTSHGDSVLHLAVESNILETLQFLLTRCDVDDEQLNLKNEKGNTILHLAVARKQLQTVKLLLGKQGIEVNAMNTRNRTALDVLLDSPSQHGDLLIGELIRAAGGRTATEVGIVDQHTVTEHNDAGIAPSGRSRSRRMRHYFRLGNDEHNAKEPNSEEKYNNKPNTLMVVATLIATMTFQAGLNPPGGFNQKDESGTPPSPFAHDQLDQSTKEGEAVLNKGLKWFLFLDMVGLFASLSIILLLICCVPRKKKLVMGILKWILWISVFSTALAFSAAISKIFRSSLNIIFLASWFLLLYIFMLWVFLRMLRWLLRKGGCWKMKRGDGEHSKEPRMFIAVITKIIVAVLILVLLVVFAVFTFIMVFYIKGLIRGVSVYYN